MRRIQVKRVGENPYILDCIRIKGIFAKNGFDITQEQARELWENFSESISASWSILDKYGDVAIYNVLFRFWDELPTERSQRMLNYLSTYADVRAACNKTINRQENRKKI